MRDGARTALRPSDLLPRLSIAADYIESRNPYPVAVRFFHGSVLDVLDPLGEALFVANREGDWEEAARAGGPLDVPRGFVSWKAVNQEAVLARRPLRLETRDGKPHLAVPRERRTGTYQVLHVALAARDLSPALLDDAAAFLDIVARLLALQDGTWWHDRRRSQRPTELTQRQQQILDLMRAGMTYARIGVHLGFSESTVKQEAMRVFDVLGVRDRAAAVRQAWPADRAERPAGSSPRDA